MYLRIETLKLTFPGNLQNSVSVAQHSLPDEKNHRFPVSSTYAHFQYPFSLHWCLLLPCSSIWGSCFHLSGHEGFTLIFHRRCNQSILFVLCQSPPVLAAAKNRLTGEVVFSSTLKAAASQFPNKAINQTALQLLFWFGFLPKHRVFH